ncbi:MAG TPA: hypothetical protein VJH03_26185 [Blastocatellia bacterium]|nr:hypothetical protein [Blastocatellia bacterium]
MANGQKNGLLSEEIGSLIEAVMGEFVFLFIPVILIVALIWAAGALVSRAARKCRGVGPKVSA